MRVDVPEDALKAGFINEPVGTHTSRTIMLGELRGLLSSVEASGKYGAYQSAIVEQNVVHKATNSTRLKTLRHLRELYALSSELPVFRTLRTLWDADRDAQPLLAILFALARDPVLRSTLDDVLAVPVGDEVRPVQLANAVSASFPGHYGPDVLARTARNIASSWEQSGVVRGRARKIRQRPCTTPVNTAFALYLGHLCGVRADALFTTHWARVLDRSDSELRRLAAEASRQGWLTYRQAGGVTEVRFNFLERAGEA